MSDVTSTAKESESEASMCRRKKPFNPRIRPFFKRDKTSCPVGPSYENDSEVYEFMKKNAVKTEFPREKTPVYVYTAPHFKKRTRSQSLKRSLSDGDEVVLSRSPRSRRSSETSETSRGEGHISRRAHYERTRAGPSGFAGPINYPGPSQMAGPSSFAAQVAYPGPSDHASLSRQLGFPRPPLYSPLQGNIQLGYPSGYAGQVGPSGYVGQAGPSGYGSPMGYAGQAGPSRYGGQLGYPAIPARYVTPPRNTGRPPYPVDEAGYAIPVGRALQARRRTNSGLTGRTLSGGDQPSHRSSSTPSMDRVRGRVVEPPRLRERIRRWFLRYHGRYQYYELGMIYLYVLAAAVLIGLAIISVCVYPAQPQQQSIWPWPTNIFML